MVVRQPMGLEEYEVEGRHDGERPHGMESALEFQFRRLAAANQAGATDAFRLTAADCAELFDEGTIYYYRFMHFFHLKDWVRAARDTARNLRLLDFVKRHAEREEDGVQLEQWRPNLARMNATADTMVLLEKGQFDEALKIAGESILLYGPLPPIHSLKNALLQMLRETLAISPDLRPGEQSLFRRQGDYWTIRYQGKLARLKATRGLQCLTCLLRDPGREFHVSELIAELADTPVLAGAEAVVRQESGFEMANAHALTSGSILDARAKAEYRHRLQDLREDLEEPERFNDSERAATIRGEMDLIAEQLASAVGLGGRDRRTGSDAERARSAVTKRIKESINRISEVIPSLGRHLAVRIKTGYFCSYNPHPDRPVIWKF